MKAVKDPETKELGRHSAGERERPAPKNAKERLYDKIPLTLRQVDMVIKALFIILILALALGIMTGKNG